MKRNNCKLEMDADAPQPVDPLANFENAWRTLEKAELSIYKATKKTGQRLHEVLDHYFQKRLTLHEKQKLTALILPAATGEKSPNNFALIDVLREAVKRSASEV